MSSASDIVLSTMPSRRSGFAFPPSLRTPGDTDDFSPSSRPAKPLPLLKGPTLEAALGGKLVESDLGLTVGPCKLDVVLSLEFERGGGARGLAAVGG